MNGILEEINSLWQKVASFTMSKWYPLGRGGIIDPPRQLCVSFTSSKLVFYSPNLQISPLLYTLVILGYFGTFSCTSKFAAWDSQTVKGCLSKGHPEKSLKQFSLNDITIASLSIKEVNNYSVYGKKIYIKKKLGAKHLAVNNGVIVTTYVSLDCVQAVVGYVIVIASLCSLHLIRSLHGHTTSSRGTRHARLLRWEYK